MDGFEEWWKLYPRKCAKGDARKAWTQTQKIRPPLPQMIKALYAARASKAWNKDEGEFIPHPATYLRGERWEDEYEVDLQNLNSATGKVCAYCAKPSSGSANGRYACAMHFQMAMDGVGSNVVNMKG